MLLNIVVLFLSAFLGGVFIYIFPKINTANFKLVLVFAGSYLFSITVIHIFPELYASGQLSTGFFVLIGFFMQHFLEYFTSGVEHGHLHKLDATHHHTKLSWFFLLTALSIHSFLEGTLLAHPATIHTHHGAKTLLIGIVLHKIPAAFALMSVLRCQITNKGLSLLSLIIFSLASPAGLLVSDYLSASHLITENLFVILFALVSGNFLHISTTIFFESSPEHSFNGKKMIVSIIGAVIAVVAESFF